MIKRNNNNNCQKNSYLSLFIFIVLTSSSPSVWLLFIYLLFLPITFINAHTYVQTHTYVSKRKNSQISIIHKHNNNIFLTKSYKTLNKYINTHSLIWWAWLKQSLTKYSQLIDISPVLPMQVVCEWCMFEIYAHVHRGCV